MSREKVVVEYDASTGDIFGVGESVPVTNWLGLKTEPVVDKPDVRDLIKLKEVGFSAEEIVEMRNGGLL